VPTVTASKEWEVLAKIEAEAARRVELIAQRQRWLDNPDIWANERLGYTLWSKQIEIMHSVRDNRRTAVQTCHGIGKSFSAAVLVGWWIDTHEPGEAIVVTSAPTARQVELILWKEIGRVHAHGELAGYTTTTDWKIEIDGKTETVAVGRKPDEHQSSAFQGVHAKYVLAVFDEACGIPASLWVGADAIISNDTSKMLAIGNPDDPSTRFAQVCKPGSGWQVIRVSAFETPAFTGEELDPEIVGQLIGRLYVEENRRWWAPAWFWVDEHGKRVEDPRDGVRCVCPEGQDPTDTHPFWQSKVLGLFPEKNTTNGLIPLSHILAAQQRNLTPATPVEIGQDVGRGGDSSTIAIRRGPVVRIHSEDTIADTMITCGNMMKLLRETDATVAKVDMIGVGAGVVDRANEILNGHEKNYWKGKRVEGVNVGESARDKERFVGLRDELWWTLRERFERGEIDIDAADEKLAAELVEIRYKPTSNGKIKVESKEEMAKRGVRSPNRADAVMLAFAPVEIEATVGLTWGR
jgi:hypothetical protein